MQRFPANRRSRSSHLPTWNFAAFEHRVTLIQSGVGIINAGKAAAAAAELTPDIIISVGFCGALSEGAPLGQVFLAGKIHFCAAGVISPAIVPDQQLATRIGNGMVRATFITADEITAKACIRSLLPEASAVNVLEMESGEVARICQCRNISFAALRSVSDTAEQDPSSLFRRICDDEFEVRMTKVALSLLKKPSILADYLQLSRAASLAGRTLAAAVAGTLERI